MYFIIMSVRHASVSCDYIRCLKINNNYYYHLLIHFLNVVLVILIRQLQITGANNGLSTFEINSHFPQKNLRMRI